MSIQDDMVREYMKDAFKCLGIKPDVRVIDSALNLYKKVSCPLDEGVGETKSSDLPSVGSCVGDSTKGLDSSIWNELVQIKLGGVEFNMSVDSFMKIGYKLGNIE